MLKPVDDTRMTEKMAASMAASGRFEVSVIGYPSAGPIPRGVRALALPYFERLSLARWWARWRILQLAFSLQPHVFIFSTHELIFPAIVLKVIRNTRIIYDVRENYYRNIRHSEGLPALVRWPIAWLVRLKENVFAPAIDHFLLAEKGYEDEFRFHRGGWTVIENKALRMPYAGRQVDPQHMTLLFSGTLSESTGVFRAIDLVNRLYQEHPGIRLVIAGFAASGTVRKKLRLLVKDKSYIQVIGIDTLVPHREILSLLRSADAGIIAYPLLPHTQNAVPTKLFEYFQARLPILTERHWPWVSRFERFAPFVIVEFENPDLRSILHALAVQSFYTNVPPDTSWEEEASRLLAVLK